MLCPILQPTIFDILMPYSLQPKTLIPYSLLEIEDFADIKNSFHLIQTNKYKTTLGRLQPSILMLYSLQPKLLMPYSLQPKTLIPYSLLEIEDFADIKNSFHLIQTSLLKNHTRKAPAQHIDALQLAAENIDALQLA
jgi:hypothetical protein